jgi:threonine synthase
MHYVSTRGAENGALFSDILLGNLAPDGGLFMPEFWPRISAHEIAQFRGESYQEVAYRILARFVGTCFSASELKRDIADAYAPFDREDVAPLVPIGPDLYLVELFHGPTLAFKDIAMRLLGRMFARQLARLGTTATVLAATSGDTGSAAIAALEGLPGVEVFVIHPHGRVSDVQRRQMTTSTEANIHNIAIEGTFDDAQAIVKTCFADHDFAQSLRLTAVNSINFVRIAAQAVYYFTAAAQLDRPPVFVVPSGNFGNAFAGEAAMRMGLPVERIVVATNANDIMARALNAGVYSSGSVQATLSPSMDIQVASNFERALFETSGRDHRWLVGALDEFAVKKVLAIPPQILAALRERYGAKATDDSETLRLMARYHRHSGLFLDPHTAVGVAAAEQLEASGPRIVLATAHPAKFPLAVEKATGEPSPLPPRLADLYDRPERMSVLPNSEAAIRSFIEARLASA